MAAQEKYQGFLQLLCFCSAFFDVIVQLDMLDNEHWQSLWTLDRLIPGIKEKGL